MQSHPEVLGVRTSTYEIGVWDTIQPQEHGSSLLFPSRSILFSSNPQGPESPPAHFFFLSRWEFSHHVLFLICRLLFHNGEKVTVGHDFEGKDEKSFNLSKSSLP